MFIECTDFQWLKKNKYSYSDGLYVTLKSKVVVYSPAERAHHSYPNGPSPLLSLWFGSYDIRKHLPRDESSVGRGGWDGGRHSHSSHISLREYTRTQLRTWSRNSFERTHRQIDARFTGTVQSTVSDIP